MTHPKHTTDQQAKADTSSRTAKTKAHGSNAAKPGQPTPYEALDRAARARVAKTTAGLAPSVLREAWMDWAVHLAVSPASS